MLTVDSVSSCVIFKACSHETKADHSLVLDMILGLSCGSILAACRAMTLKSHDVTSRRYWGLPLYRRALEDMSVEDVGLFSLSSILEAHGENAPRP